MLKARPTMRWGAIMETIVAAVVFGLIGVAVLGALVYVLGMLLSGPAIIAEQMWTSLHHQDRKAHHHSHPRLVLHS